MDPRSQGARQSARIPDTLPPLKERPGAARAAEAMERIVLLYVLSKVRTVNELV